MGRHPATGEPMKIPAKTVVRMRVATAAKEAIVPGRNRRAVSYHPAASVEIHWGILKT